MDFQYSDLPEPHKERSKQILKTNPEVRTLIGRNPASAVIVIVVVALQFMIAYLLADQVWWLTVIAAFFIGAFDDHNLFVLIHEASHNLIFKNRTLNTIFGIIADLPKVVPSYVSFKALEGVTFATTEVFWTSGAARHRSLSRAQAKKVDRGESASTPGSQPWGWDPRGGKKGEGSIRPVEMVGEVEIDTLPVAKWSKVKWRECRPVDSARWNDVVGAVHKEILRELDLGPEVALSFGQGVDAGGWRSVTLFFPSRCW